MKRVVILLLCLSLFAGLMIPAQAAEGAVITVGTVSGKTGDTVTVAVSIQNNPGFAGANFRFLFDTTALKLTQIRKGTLLTSSSGGFESNAETGVMLWYDSVNTVGDGVLAELEFEILAKGTFVDQQIGISLLNGAAKSFSSAARTAVPVTFQSGCICCRTDAKMLPEKAICDLQKETVTLTMLHTVKDQSAAAYIAVYNQKGRMCAVGETVRVLQTGENEFSLPTVPEDGYTVKIFLLQPQTTVPLCKATVCE